jgi:hypothetical protein
MISAAARGRARVFKAHVAARQQRLDATLGQPLVKTLIREFTKRSSEKGRSRAMLRLRRELDPHADFEIAKLHGRPLALWSTPVIADEGVALNYLLISPDGVRRGVWSFKVLEHGLQRYFERGGRDLASALLQANRACIKRKLFDLPTGEVLVSAPPGAFIGDTTEGGFGGGKIVVGKTWLHVDQLHFDQELLLADR